MRGTPAACVLRLHLPSIWWNSARWVLSTASFLNTRSMEKNLAGLKPSCDVTGGSVWGPSLCRVISFAVLLLLYMCRGAACCNAQSRYSLQPRRSTTAYASLYCRASHTAAHLGCVPGASVQHVPAEHAGQAGPRLHLCKAVQHLRGHCCRVRAQQVLLSLAFPPH